jgi:hypothetical protein
MLKMASLISTYNIRTLLDQGATCASACFWLFAAGHDRSMPITPQLGVHSASTMAGGEATDTTVILARLSHAMGIPNQIIGKMVATPPNEITWLDCDDLAAMKVDVIWVKGLDVAPMALKRRVFCKDRSMYK